MGWRCPTYSEFAVMLHGLLSDSLDSWTLMYGATAEINLGVCSELTSAAVSVHPVKFKIFE